MQTGNLKRSLNLWHIVLLGVGYMTPMVVFDTFGIVSEKTGGMCRPLISLLFWQCCLQQPVMEKWLKYIRRQVHPIRTHKKRSVRI